MTCVVVKKKEERRGSSEVKARGAGGEQAVRGDGEKKGTGGFPLHGKGKEFTLMFVFRFSFFLFFQGHFNFESPDKPWSQVSPLSPPFPGIPVVGRRRTCMHICARVAYQ